MYLPLAECVAGTTHNLRHPQVLPLSAAVSTQSGYHPGEKGRFINSEDVPVYTALNIFLFLCNLLHDVLLVLQFLACLAQLPPPMNTTDILWVSCFSCPLLRYMHTVNI